MKEGGRFPPERLIEQQLPRGRGQKIRASHDFRDPHRGVVHRDRQLIGREIVLPPDDKIAEIGSGKKGLRTMMGVDEGDSSAVGNAEAPAAAGGGCDGRGGFVPAGAGIDGFLLDGMGSRERSEHVLSRANARIEKAAGEELFEGRAVVGLSGAL
jgi:hypothetical protein